MAWMTEWIKYKTAKEKICNEAIQEFWEDMKDDGIISTSEFVGISDKLHLNDH